MEEILSVTPLFTHKSKVLKKLEPCGATLFRMKLTGKYIFLLDCRCKFYSVLGSAHNNALVFRLREI
jgi:hypothetical protein